KYLTPFLANASTILQLIPGTSLIIAVLIGSPIESLSFLAYSVIQAISSGVHKPVNILAYVAEITICLFLTALKKSCLSLSVASCKKFSAAQALSIFHLKRLSSG